MSITSSSVAGRSLSLHGISMCVTLWLSVPVFMMNLHILLALSIDHHSNITLSVSGCQARKISPTKHSIAHSRWFSLVVFTGIAATFELWLSIIILLSGDVHPNPGPDSISSISSTCSNKSSGLSDALSINNHFSFMHYNVQSILHKIDILTAELYGFDILTFSETWLNNTIDSVDLAIPGFHTVERRDRGVDGHGGVCVYVKSSLNFKRRLDLELNDLECLWVEVTLPKRKHVLLGTFYRPPNSNQLYSDMISQSIGLAVDTGIRSVIVTGDFNYNTNVSSSVQNIQQICQQYDMTQLITDSTHFTENSSSILDLIFVTCPNDVVLSGVGESIFDQNIRYHCPVFGIFKFCKPCNPLYTRQIWNYERADFNDLREKFSTTCWQQCMDDDIDIYSTNITNKIISTSQQVIPNRIVTIRPSEPPWMTQSLKNLIRKRKRCYKMAKKKEYRLMLGQI